MIQILEDLVRAGKFAEAKTLLGSLRLRQLNRADALRYANIARRVHDFRLALTILNPVIRGTMADVESSAQEKIEYAESLRKLGAINEAQTMLREIDAGEFPEVLMVRAFCHFSKWEYREAIPLLKTFTRSPKIEEYRKRVAQLNLAAAHVFLEEIEEASALLDELRSSTERANQDLLHGNALELTAQLHLQLNQPEQAYELLRKASEILKQVSGIDMLFVEKWKAVVGLRLGGSDISLFAIEQLRQVRLQAVESAHWETVRDCDFYLSLACQDQALWMQVYFGTPFASYRVKALSRAQKLPPVERHFVHQADPHLAVGKFIDVELGRLIVQEPLEMPLRPSAELQRKHSPAAETVVIDRRMDDDEGAGRRTQMELETRTQLPEGQLLHRLLIVLTRDRYRSLPLLEVFGALFSDEFYNPKSSPNRVHQAVKKFREWLKDVGADLELMETDGSYRLLPGRTTGIRVPREPLPLDQDQLLTEKVHRALLDRQTITARELALQLEVSLATAKRLLVRTAKLGTIELIGAGPSAHYRKVDSTQILADKRIARRPDVANSGKPAA